VSISVVTSTFRRPRYLAQALESIAAQTLQPDEVVVVNNDKVGASEVERVVSENFPDAMLITNDSNLGQAGSKNVGIRAAKSEVVALLDDDDTWDRGFLEAHSRTHEGGSVDVVYSGYTVFWDDLPMAPKEIPATAPPPDVFEQMIRGRFTIGTNSVLSIRRSALVDVGGYDESLTGFLDWDLLCRVAKFGTFAHIPDPLAYFRMHLGARDSDPNVRQTEVAEIRRKWDGTDGIEELVSRFSADSHYNASRYLALRGQRSRAISEWWSYVTELRLSTLDTSAFLKLSLLNAVGPKLYMRLQRGASRHS
jgi:glycosyltransferase involved in cell wall biosynthesis